ncbi:holo-ACP synthase [Thalassobacillus pellis]|uniref:holo-ACP synthase n=1 Tax=Thalassobacillus pellis TaxID=748008 RepID=UPI00195F3E81|nr:holo-ACP synthase [Thalassobacillus pellis]MBM7554388.1 holo-[acyl-carrier protein] synthase [Thalassobacillus pellis]
MIRGIGIDLVELGRINKIINRNERFLQRILTPNERELYNKYKTDSHKIEFAAGRYAAKEAFAKAAGTGIGRLSFQDIEVLRHESGAPVIKGRGFEHFDVWVSISHSSSHAIAQVILEEQDNSA